MAKKYFTNESLQTLVDETKGYVDDATDKFGGTVEITTSNPIKENTVLTLNPNGEEVSIYTAVEVDSIIDSYGFITVADIDEICGSITEGSLPQSDIDELMARLQ